MKKAYFISDIHLGARYNEETRAVERSVVRFLDNIKHQAAELYLLGDILDYWFEYRHVVPKGFVRFFGKLAELADSGVKITWLIGNHDIWIFDYIPQELGVNVVDGILEREIMGVRFSLQHGDAIGGNFKFRLLRKLFRNRFCQKLYGGIHPRWTVGFAFACSRRSRMKKRVVDEWPNNLIQRIREWCALRIREGDMAEYFVFGHLHSLYDESLPEGKHLIVVPDWPGTLTYGIFDGHDFKFEKFDAGVSVPASNS